MDLQSGLQLGAMIKCSTGRMLSYLGYGCYCGLGGKGWPRDRTDWCCFNHDCCYRKAESVGCRPKSHTYNWYCNKAKETPRCRVRNNRCQEKNCECDVTFSNCLKRANYQMRYAFWPNFLCGNSEPKC
ncbi:phospholipase A2-like [Amblyraja radiata]|uniref:phospholipase A2-like n=1 Tax=Amblyraja radiata TaxID=386614 RepID=UPI0014037B77|nr:phospholipase A2-like [Amblyraja radiata]